MIVSAASEPVSVGVQPKLAGRWARIAGLSALLLVGQGVLGGFFYETNDDLLMELLVRGITGATHVNNLHLYLHGWSQLLAQLYKWAPLVPWYGLALYFTLYLALVVSYQALPENDPMKRKPDITLAREVLGWEPKIDRAEGLRRTLEYFKEHVSV